MKFLLSLSLLAAVPAFALPIPSHEAIQGLAGTDGLRVAQKSALAALRYYDAYNVVITGRKDTAAMAACYPGGAISKSATLLKVTFSNTYAGKSRVHYFTTPERAEDIELCDD